jgi:hypothetical protein
LNARLVVSDAPGRYLGLKDLETTDPRKLNPQACTGSEGEEERWGKEWGGGGRRKRERVRAE